MPNAIPDPALSATNAKQSPSEAKVSELLARARKRFDRAIESEAQNRSAAVDDLRFKAGDQWDPGIKARREAKQRPCITVNKMLTFVHQVTNDQRQNRPAINISPVGDKSDKKTAQMLKGLIREIERDSDADIAYDTGFDNTVSNGFGYWRVLTEYESEDSFDQVIRIKRIRNPFTVYLDCDRQQPDGSDAKWGFVTEMIPRYEFEETWPDADPVSWDMAGQGENYRNWCTGTQIRIAEYFEVETETRKLVALRNGHVGYDDDLSPEIKEQIKADPDMVLDTRDAECRKVMWYKITAKDILDQREWLGQWIPIIECVGDEVDIEGKVQKSGVIRHAKGPQQMYNYAATSNIEVTALQSKAPWTMAEGQDEGHEQEWQSANTETYSVLHYKPTALDGKLVPPPQHNPPVGAPPGWMEMQASAAQDMMAVTGIRFDSTLAERTQDESGIALQRLAAHQQLGAYHYIDNFARSLKHTGRIIVDLIPKVYDTPRIVTILREDGAEEHVKIDPHAGKSYEMKPGQDGKNQKIFNPNMGRFEVAVTIGPSYATRRQESSHGMIEYAKAFPNKADLVADLVAKEQDWPNSDEIAKRVAMTLPPGMLQPEESDLSPQVQALIGQLQQQLQQAQQQIQGMGAALQDKQADRALDADKINKDFEAKVLAIIEKSMTAQASLQEKRDANVLTHLRAELEAIRAMESPARPGNGGMQ